MLKRTINNFPKIVCVLMLIILTSIFFVGCSDDKVEVSNKNITEFGQTGLSFFVDKDATYKDELLGAVNEAIKKLGGGFRS